ncbi:MAG: Regulator of RpoS [Myxococcota bacterium]|nr:Regulator of RpoS [Myxococcota bacterium]
MKLGEVLLEAKLIEEWQLFEALAENKKNRTKSLGLILVEKGFVSEKDIVEVLARKFNLGGVVLSDRLLDLRVLSYISRKIAKSTRAIPLRATGNNVTMAMVDPINAEYLDLLRRDSGKQITPLVCLDMNIEQLLDNAYDAYERGERIFQIGSPFKAAAQVQPPVRITSGFHEPPPPSIKPQKQFMVLVVDDDPEIVKLLTAFMEKMGYLVRTATNSTQALNRMAGETPDLIVMDAMLPGMSGFQLSKHIKSLPEYKHIPVVMMSAIFRGDGYHADAIATSKAEVFLEKPFNLAEVKTVVENCLAGRTPSQSPDEEHERSIIEQARDLMQNDDAGKAAELIEAELKKRPYSARLNAALATVYFKMGEDYKAIAAAERSLEISPRNFQMLFKLAGLYRKHDLTHRAVSTMARAILEAGNEQEKGAARELLQEWLG